MPYSLNPYLPKVRGLALRLVRQEGWSPAQVALHLGVHRATVYDWLKKSPETWGPVQVIETKSSRPHVSPRKVDQQIEQRIVELRLKRGRCAQVIHAQMRREGLEVSLSTVKRTLERHRLLKTRSPWKKWHQSGPRPLAETPGKLVEMDSVHILKQLNLRDRVYIVTLIDCCSRWAFARAVERLNTRTTLGVVRTAHQQAQFPFQCIQTDHGSEFSTHFTQVLATQDIHHRHTRVRQPNDNAHIERFNRTLQEELRSDILKYRTNMKYLNQALREYLRYYNTQRLHMGINFQTPQEILQLSSRS